jgi:glycerophosphoryl diester phosphodiesterase
MPPRLLSSSIVSVIAHRGGSKIRPENTMAAFDHAVALGVDALECDVHLSRDGEVVVIHDSTLERTTDVSGPVGALTAEELARVDAACRFGGAGDFPFRGRGFGVPRLRDVLDRHRQISVVVRIRGGSTRTAARVLDVLRDTDALGRVILGAFSDETVRCVRELAPAVPTSASSSEVQSALRRAIFRLPPKRTGYDLFQVPFRLRGRRIFGRTFVRTVVGAGLAVQAWIVDEEADIRRLLAWGVTGIISDRPDRAMRVVHGPDARSGAGES